MLFLLIMFTYLDIRIENALVNIIHTFMPVLFVLVIFDSLGRLIAGINPILRDNLLIKIDYFLFGVHPTVWLEKISSPFLTNMMFLSYATYYFYPIILGIVLFKKNKIIQLDETAFCVVLGFYISFIGYMLVPAVGPRFTLAQLQSLPIGGTPLSNTIYWLLNFLENTKTDAFPSGHTAIVLIILYCAYRFERRLFYIFLPVIMALIFSTVYCRYHYVIDVLAGIFLAIISIILTRLIFKSDDRLQTPDLGLLGSRRL